MPRFSLYRREGSKFLWAKFVDPTDGKTRRKSTKCTNRRDAETAMRMLLQHLARECREAEARGDRGTPTVRARAKVWLANRERLGIANVANEVSHFETWIFPMIGNHRLDELTKADMRRVIRELKMSDLAGRTVRRVWGTLHSMIQDAVDDEVIERSPCAGCSKDLPPNRDADQEWREGAIFSRDEERALLACSRIPADRKMLYALAAYTGGRLGEVVTLQWGDVSDADPLRMLRFRRSHNRQTTKTGVVRKVPVHPELEEHFLRWKPLWVADHGRDPQPDDLVVPTAAGKARTKNHVRNKLLADLKRAGLRHHGFHDFRRAFVTHTQAMGADPMCIRQMTHTRPINQDVFESYAVREWSTLCAAIRRFSLEPSPPEPTPDAVPPSAPRPLGSADSCQSSRHILGTVLGTVTENRTADQSKAPESLRKPGLVSGGGAGSRTRDRGLLIPNGSGSRHASPCDLGRSSRRLGSRLTGKTGFGRGEMAG